jgi:hypothetical protein
MYIYMRARASLGEGREKEDWMVVGCQTQTDTHRDERNRRCSTFVGPRRHTQAELQLRRGGPHKQRADEQMLLVGLQLALQQTPTSRDAMPRIAPEGMPGERGGRLLMNNKIARAFGCWMGK